MEKRSTRGKRPKGTPPDPVRSVRVSNEVWDKAHRRATYEGITMSHVLIAFVEGYADGMLNLPRVVVSYQQPGNPMPPVAPSEEGVG